MGDVTADTLELLERLPELLAQLEARWAWAVAVVAAVLVVRFALVPLVRAWRGAPPQ